MNNSQKLDLSLENQFHIMRYLWTTETSKVPMHEEGLYEQIQKTLSILNEEKEKLRKSKELEEQRNKIINGASLKEEKE